MRIQCLLPKYNNGDYFEKAIESLIHQSVPFDSILISENHSTDGSEKLAEQYANIYNNVSCFIPEKPALTFGANVAELIKRIDENIDYVLIASSDDIWDLDFNKEMISFINKFNTNLTAAYCDRWIIDKTDKIFSVSGNLRTKEVLYLNDKQAFTHFSNGCSYIIAGAFFHIDVIKSLASLAEITESSFDWFLILEAARNGNIGYNSKPLFKYRLHEYNSTRTEANHTLGYTKYIQYYIDYLRKEDPESMIIFQNNQSSSNKTTENFKRIISYKPNHLLRLTLRKYGIFNILRCIYQKYIY